MGENMAETDYNKFWSPAFDNMDDIVFIINNNSELIKVNDALLSFTGKQQKDVIGKKSCQVLYGEDVPDQNYPCQSIFDSKTALQKEFYDSSLKRWLDVRVTPLFSVQGPIGCIVLATDISERKQKEDELKKINDLNQVLLNTIPFGIDIVSESGNIMFLNSVFEGIVGKDAVGKKCWEVYKDDKFQCPPCPLIKGINVGQTETIEVDCILGGKTFQIFHTGMFYQDKKAVMEIFIDISERKKTEQLLRHALQIKSAFTSMVSHELRTPLTAIKEGISIVLDETAGILNQEQKEFLDIAKRNVDRLTRLINDVLDFQKLDTGKMTFNMQENDINEVIEDVRDTMLPLAEERNLDFTLNLAKGLPKAVFDKDKINQVFSNLVHNAIKCTEEGSIVVTTSLGENFIKVSVQDTGKGIKQEDMPRLFQQFEQLESGCDRKIPGTGLGLAIAREIIEAHKGRIWAESEPGKGSTFNFTLPVKERRN